MLPHLSPSSLKEGRLSEYVTRFIFGGAATVFAGAISSEFGASIGGLFLAMPAIFCASATLIERHEIRRKRQAGLSAAGAAIGSMGMLAFALFFWWTIEYSTLVAFLGAAVSWTVVAVAAWWIYKRPPWRHVL